MPQIRHPDGVSAAPESMARRGVVSIEIWALKIPPHLPLERRFEIFDDQLMPFRKESPRMS
ncbi:MAG: hypothetical protein Q8R40_02680, partial [bacterium]|nr:hypothetical protein [bacterium]